MPNPWNVALHLLIRPRSFERLQSVSSPSSCREVLRLTLPPLKPHFAIVSTVIRITALLELLRSRARSTFPYVLVLAGEALQVCEASFVSLGGRQRPFHLQTPPPPQWRRPRWGFSYCCRSTTALMPAGWFQCDHHLPKWQVAVH